MLDVDRPLAPSWRQNLWLGWLFVPGFGWAAFAYIGLRTRHRPWLLVAVCYFLPMLLLFLVDDGKPGNSRAEDVMVLLMLASWAGACVHGFAIREEVQARLARGRRLQVQRRVDLAEGVVDVNFAPLEELARLPGVGLMGAEVAVRLRRDAGRFHSVEHFGEALGLTPDLVAALRPLAVVREQEGDLT